MDRTETSDCGEVDLGETHVRIRLPKERAWRCAAILDRTVDPAGRVVGLVLDRNVHGWRHHTLGGWTATGALTTELSRTLP